MTTTAPGTEATILRVLDLSTGHLPQHIGQDALNSFDGVIAYELEYGWLMWLPDDLASHLASYGEDSIPSQVIAIMRYAIDLDCQYVKFDNSGATVSALPTWDW